MILIPYVWTPSDDPNPFYVWTPSDSPNPVTGLARVAAVVQELLQEKDDQG